MRPSAQTVEDMVPSHPDDVRIELLPYQDDFIFSQAPYPAAVTAWGTGKTFAGIVKAMDLSEQNPGNLGIVFRKQFVDLRDSTVRDFEQATGLSVDSKRNVELGNGSSIMFRHLEEMNNIQNVNLGWFWIEQAEELESDDQYFKLFGRLRRKGMPHTGFITANAKGHNWIWRLWKRGDFPKTIAALMDKSPELFEHLKGKNLSNLSPLFEADTFVNRANLSPTFLAGLEIMRQTKPALYNQFVLNSHDEGGSADICIQPKWVDEATRRVLNVSGPIRKLISIDVARSNVGEGDKSIFYALEGYEPIGKEEHETRNTMELVGRAVMFAKKLGIEAFAVDEIGVGGGVADRLMELGYQVIFVNAAERKDVRQGCFNRRTEIHVNAAELFEAGRVRVDVKDQNLCEQLSWARYKIIKSNGMMQIEPKDDIKERYGRSPDDADAFMNGLWAMPQVKPAQASDKYERRFLKLRRPSAGMGSSMTI